MLNMVAALAALFIAVAANAKTFNENVKVNGAITAASTTAPSHPCPSMTQTQVNALTPSDGDCVINTTTDQLQQWQSSTSSWLSLGVVAYDNSTITENGSNQLIVKSGGITGTQVASNINLPGKSVQTNSLNVIVSAANLTNGLMIVRGSGGVFTSSTGCGTLVGEGFSCSHTSAGSGSYTITFTTSFQTTPVCLCNANSVGGAGSDLCVSNGSTSGMSLSTVVSGSLADWGFNFICIGQRP